jgi:hypothetical protein
VAVVFAAKDDTMYYVHHVNAAQVAILSGTFVGAALIVVVGFVVFSWVMANVDGEASTAPWRHAQTLNPVPNVALLTPFPKPQPLF